MTAVVENVVQWLKDRGAIDIKVKPDEKDASVAVFDYRLPVNYVLYTFELR
jgi:hypothetical protein